VTWLEAIVLGLVEGLTEFLPVSSTGHLILARSLLGLEGAAVDAYLVIIQGAAILAVCWEYRGKIAEVVLGLTRERAAQRFALNIAVAFMPLAILGLLFGKTIKAYLFNAPVVATAFIVGGLIILWAERREHRIRIESLDELSLLDAMKLGLAQALALIPGTSRSGATIIGGLFFGLSRRAATEFSFFLAIPTLIAATFYQVYKERALLSFDDIGMWVVGFVAAFISAFWAVRGLLRYISTHDFSIFAWYRIAFGIVVLVTWKMDLIAWSNP